MIKKLWAHISAKQPRQEQRKCANDHGSIILTSAILLGVFAGAVGLGVDVANWYDNHLRLQTAADAGVRSAMLAKMNGTTANAELMAIARMQAERNGYDYARGILTVFSPPRGEDFTNSDGVELVLTQNIARQFTRLFSSSDVLLQATAIALPITSSPPCILALNRTAAATINISGSSSLTAEGCEVTSNSTNPSAITINGSASLTSKCASSSGAIASSAGMTLECGSPREYALPSIDPFKDVPTPLVAGPCLPATILKGLHGIPEIGVPGRYCNGLTIQGLAVLLPGVYIIDGGTLTINATADVVGLGVTFFLTNGANVKVNGTADMDLHAPSIGPYAGILFYADPANGDVSHDITGTTDSVLDGALYFPNQDVKFSGGAVAPGVCTMIVADSVEILGTSGLSTDCDHLNLPLQDHVTSVRLAR